MAQFRLAVCGLHLRGQPLNWQLTDLSATFVKACKSAPVYQLYAFTDDQGKTKPGMIRPLPTDSCTAVHLEVWEMPIENFGKFMLQVPAPLGIGTVDLDDGSQVKGFICEAWVAEAAAKNDARIEDITHLGSWLKYIEQKQNAS